jgi:NTP pyrophosphatase (non-canonical NTP hydrolase)
VNLDDYQNEAKRTAPRGDAYPPEIQRLADNTTSWAEECGHSKEGAREAKAGLRVIDQMVWALGLTGEAGEVADLLKKGFGHGHGVDREKLQKELGDVLWYLAVLADSFGLTLSEVARANVAKLRARYPTGFSIEASKAKADEAQRVERVLLAGSEVKP